ncbi:MAG: hypothetical protein FWE16_01225 [Firmicutes bacterium]|nr:hypothetical protein [Bacillota bacterium]
MPRIENQSEYIIHACNDWEAIKSNEIYVDVIDLDCYTITKTTPCGIVFKGREITFCTTIKSNCPDHINTGERFRDILSMYVEYVPDSFTVNGQHRVPTIIGGTSQTVEYTLQDSDWTSDNEVMICFRVRIKPESANDE